MRRSGRMVRQVLDFVRALVSPGATTMDLERAAEQKIRELGAKPAFKGYYDYPCVLCTSVNEEIVHGIPSPTRVLRDGDLLTIDCGCILDGWHSDSAVSLHVGEPPEESGAAEVDLINAAEEAMWAGIAAAQAGGRLGQVTSAIEGSVRRSASQDGRRYGEVQGYGGHGIGSRMHMDPFVPNFGKSGKGLRLPPGLALAIEPMLTLGGGQSRELADGWTVVTKDGSRAAHVEHSIALTDDGICVLTAADGGAARLAPFGIEPISLD